MSGKLQKAKSRFAVFNNVTKGPTKAEYAIGVFFVLCAAFLFCFMKDFRLTVTQSLDFLDCLFSGKALRFYSEVNELALSGYYGKDWPQSLLAGANYSVINYATVGFICLPVYIIDRFFGVTVSFLVYEFVVKLAFALILCWLAKIMYDICKTLRPEGKDAGWAALCFLTSPVFLYSSIVISHLDIFSILFLMLGIRCMVKEKRMPGLVFFMLAAAYKPFVLLGILPMLFLREKRVLYLLRDFIFVMAGILAQSVIYRFDPGYGETQKFMSETYDFLGRFFGTGFGFTRNCYDSVASYFVIAFVVICVVAYLVKKTDWQVAFTLAFAVMGAFVMFVKWHPNWMVLIVPYMMLMLLYTYNIRVMCILEFVFSLFVILVSGFGWWHHYGIRILNGGVISQLLGLKADKYHDIYKIIPRMFPQIPNDIYSSILCATVLGFLVLFALDWWRKKRGVAYDKDGRRWERCAVWFRVLPAAGYMAYAVLVAIRLR